MDNALNAAAYCEQQYNKLCKPKPNPQPAQVPVEDKDFMKKMEELTGLAGAALIVYLIISEGSRLFPPRNLLPIP